MSVSAIDEPALVKVSENGIKGDDGTNGQDGAGFNQIRKSLIDNPISWLYTKNNIVRVLKNVLTVSRTSSGAYTDIYGVAQTADDDTPREEATGWLINGNEVDQFQVIDNIPQINADFSAVVRVGSYSENSVSQKIFTIPATAGDLLSVGTDTSGNWVATLQGSDAIQYEAATVINATSASDQTVIITYTALTGVLNIFIAGVIAGTVTLPTSLTATLKTDESLVSISGDFNLNMKGLRFYDFNLNQEEITYLN